MHKIEFQTEIEAPPEVLFDLLADHSKHTLWNPNIIEARLYEEGPIVKGSKGIMVGKLKGRRIENEVYYDEYNKPRYVIGGTSSGNVEAKMSNVFIPTEKGTEITYRLEVQFKGFMRLLQPFLKRSLLNQKKEEMKALSDYVSKNK